MNRAAAVIIIGGGIAGLGAALELARRRVSTIVLEAKSRFGGRIHTVRDHGLAIELGAEFVHGRGKPLLEAIQNARLSTQAVPGSNQIFENGRLEECNVWDTVSEVLKRVDRRKPDSSLEDFLAGQPLDERTRRLVRNFVTGFDAAHTDCISAHACLLAELSGEQMDLPQELRIADGYAGLVEYFTREITARGGGLVSGAKVRRVRWQPGNIEVLASRDGGEEIFQGDAGIVTLPVGVLKAGDVLFEPFLPDKAEAANRLQFGNVVKVIFHFRESSWGDFGFIHAPGAALPTWWSDARGPILTGWAGGTDADALLRCSSDELRSLGLALLSKILRASVQALERGLLAVHYYNWAGDPEIRGAYSYIPVNGMDLPGRLAEPVAGTLFFAGEATVTDGQTGTVFSALESGQRAAREFLSKM
ncbi:MAG: flavin monoamine oxidase family protein [Limisphaerales bacterium]